MTNFEYNAERAANYRLLAAETSDRFLKKFYLSAAQGHDLRNMQMTLQEAMQERKC